MTESEKPKDDAEHVDVKEQKEQALLAEASRLRTTGFNNEQIAQQMSAKYTMTVDEVTALLAKHADDKPAEPKPAT